MTSAIQPTKVKPKPRFKVGQIVVRKDTDFNRPIRISDISMIQVVWWYTEEGGDDWSERELRKQTRKEAGR